MLADTLSVATMLHTWPWWRIHRSRVPKAITELSHQRCLYYSKKTQSNGVCKRINQTVGNILRTLLHGEPPQNIASAKEYIDEALSIAMHAMRAGIHSTLGSSPGSLTFNRDMILNIPLIADWHAITQRWEHLINKNLIKENQKQRCYDYVLQQRVLVKKWNPPKLGERTSGPYRVLQTCVNGTLTIELRPRVSERLNIRRVLVALSVHWFTKVVLIS